MTRLLWFGHMTENEAAVMNHRFNFDNYYGGTDWFTQCSGDRWAGFKLKRYLLFVGNFTTIIMAYGVQWWRGGKSEAGGTFPRSLEFIIIDFADRHFIRITQTQMTGMRQILYVRRRQFRETSKSLSLSYLVCQIQSKAELIASDQLDIYIPSCKAFSLIPEMLLLRIVLNSDKRGKSYK